MERSHIFHNVPACFKSPDRMEWTPDRMEWTPDRMEWTPDRMEWTQPASRIEAGARASHPTPPAATWPSKVATDRTGACPSAPLPTPLRLGGSPVQKIGEVVVDDAAGASKVIASVEAGVHQRSVSHKHGVIHVVFLGLKGTRFIAVVDKICLLIGVQVQCHLLEA
jgi:hypothetical protein